MISLRMLRPLCVGLALLVVASTAHAKKPKKKKAESVRHDGVAAQVDGIRPYVRPPSEDADEDEVLATDEQEEVLNADVPAEDPPDEGIWAWVERMDGELPTEDEVEAIEEMTAEERAEQAKSEEVKTSPEVAPKVEKKPSAAPDPLHLDQVDPKEFDIPIVVNDDVRKWVDYFANGSGRKYYARWMSRSSRYRPMMYAELEKAGLPRDLVYLSMIESGYNAFAYSHAHAAGLWQFIPGTAKLYKLRVDWWVDERRDPAHATKAALAFLGELHQMFGDWSLAMAAYNTGPGNVRRVTRETGKKDYWEIRSRLHPETRRYVPKIMAAAIIGHHPERYGFTDISFQDKLTYDTVKVDKSVEVARLAKASGMTTKEFQRLNPALKRWATPPEGYVARVPVGKGKDLQAKVAKMPKAKRVEVVRHTVRRGETLSGIASKYKVSASALARANRLRNANRIYVGMKLVIPGRGGAVSGTSARKASAKPTTYTVRRGDSLSAIAARYKVSVSQIKAWNGLKSSTIQVGQKLTLRAGRAPASSRTTSSTYVVRKGDTLSVIAAKHGVSVGELKAWNGIKNASAIYVGQKLALKKGASSGRSSGGWVNYVVKGGDSLGAIAQKHGCTVSQIKSWNGLKTTVIQPGQKLKLKR